VQSAAAQNLSSAKALLAAAQASRAAKGDWSGCMKSLLRDIRLIPILLIATCCLVVLKVSGLLLEGGYILGDDMPKPKSWAQETLGFPAPGRMLDAPDITGSVPKKEESRRRGA
jgi:hypothetical protein